MGARKKGLVLKFLLKAIRVEALTHFLSCLVFIKIYNLIFSMHNPIF